MERAVNPQTGAVVELRQGQWVPVPTAKNPNTGEILVHGDRGWEPLHPAQPQSFGQGLAHGLGFGTRATAEGLAGLPLIVGDAINGAVNLGIRGANRMFNTNIPTLPSASQSFDAGLNAVGLPQPKTEAERMIAAVDRAGAASVLPGAAVMRAAGKTTKLASPLLERIVSQARSAPVKFARQEATAAAASGVGAETAHQVAPQNPYAEMIGSFLGPALPSIVGGAVRAPFRGEAGVPQMQRNINDFTQAGATPSVGQAAGTRRSQALESVLARLPGGGGPLARQAQKTAQALGKSAQDLSARLARSPEPDVAGRTIRGGIEDFVNRFRNTADQLYNRLDNYLPEQQLIPATNTTQALMQLTAPIPGARNLSGILSNPKIAEIYQAFKADVQNGALPYLAMKNLRSQVGRLLSTSELHTGMPKAEIKRIYGALSQDIGQAARDAGQEASNAFNRADAYYRSGIQRIDDQLQPLVKKANPEDIFKAATQGADGATRIRAVKRSLTPDQWNVVTGALLRRLGKARPGAQNEVQEVFSPETFLTNWNRLSPVAKSELFSGSRKLDQYRSNIEAIAKAASRIREGSRVLANPSGTAAQMGNISAASIAGYAALSGDLQTPLLIGLGTLSSNAASRLMTNPQFVRWLARSTAIPASRLPGYVARLGVAMRTESPEDKNATQEYLRQFTTRAKK